MRLLPVLLCAVACQRAPKQTAAAAVAKASTEPAPSVAAAANAAASKPWFEGSWRGTYQAELFRLEVPVGGVKEWKQDDGKRGTGVGQLSLEAQPDGSVSGSATGALGELSVTGQIQGDRAALTLASTQPDGFHGVILASQSAGGMQGTLSASSGDSLQARRANVTLSRVTP